MVFYLLRTSTLTFTDNLNIGRFVVMHTVGKATDGIRDTGWLTALLDLLQIGLSEKKTN